MANALNNLEIIQIVENVAKDKSLPKEAIITAIEQAVQVSSKKRYGLDTQIKVKIHPNTGEMQITREREVVDVVENYSAEISLADALLGNPNAKLGDIVIDPLPPIDIARIAAQSAKQVITQEIRKAEREKQYEEFKDKIGEIINGTVKRIDFGDVIVDSGRGEAVLKKSNTLRGENFRIGNRIRAYIEDVRQETKGPQVILSRVHNQFLAQLFAQEVPEVYDKIIEIKAISREPGSKAKVAVYTKDMNIDPVGSCVGVRGSRIQTIIDEISGEKIDIIKWSEDPAKFIINALSPTTVSKVILDEDTTSVEVVVPNDQLSLAIGRMGQNVRLASKLTGWKIDILTDEQESSRRLEEFNTSSKIFMEQLELEEVLAQLLSSEGFSNIEDIAYSAPNELASIEAIDEPLAEQIIARAQKVLSQQNQETYKEIQTLGVEKNMMDIFEKIMSPDKILKLANKGVKTFEDLADLSTKEFKEILPNSGLTDEYIEKLLEKAKSS